MKQLRPILTLIAAIGMACPITASEIKGVVQDSTGQPVAHATVNLFTKSLSLVKSVVTADDGAYGIQLIDPGQYELRVVAAGHFDTASKSVQLEGKAASMTVDFTLAASPAPLHFEAAGVRGLIDPGGYSAPVQAAAASSIVTGIASLRKNTLSPCDRELARPRTPQADPTNASIERSETDLFNEGYELLVSGKLAEASAVFESALRQTPTSETLLIGAGAVAFLQNDPALAIRYLLRATDLRPLDPRPYSFLAQTLATPGVNVEQVTSALKRFHDLAPLSAHANYFYALALLHGHNSSQNKSEAERSLKMAIGLDPALAGAHFELAALLAETGNDTAAAGEYEACLRYEPNRADAHYRLAMMYRKQGDSDNAARELARFKQLHASAQDALNENGIRSILNSTPTVPEPPCGPSGS